MDNSTDYLIFDEDSLHTLATVTHISRNNAGDIAITIDNATRMKKIDAEKEDSGGVYVGKTTQFKYPAIEFSAAPYPKVGDQIVQTLGDLQSWNVIEVREPWCGGYWALDCVAVDITDELCDLADYYTVNDSTNVNGDRVLTGILNQYQMKVRIQPIGANQIDFQGKKGFVSKYIFYCDTNTLALPSLGDYFLFDDKRYKVTGWEHPRSITNLLAIETIRQP